MTRLLLLLAVACGGAGCQLLGLEPAACTDDATCPSGESCDGGRCVLVVGEGEGDVGEGEGDVGEGEGEGEGDVGEGEGDVGEGEGEGEGDGEGEGEDETCVIGGACNARVLARNLKEPRGIALVDGRVFFTAGGIIAAGCVKEVTGGVGQTRDVFCETGASLVRPVQLVATSTHLYWINDDAIATASVRRATLAGAEATTVASIDYSSSSPRKRSILATNGVTVGWLTQAESGERNVITEQSGGGGQVARKSVDSFPKALAMSATELFFGDNVSGVSRLPLAALPSQVPTVLMASDAALTAAVVVDDNLRAFGFADGSVRIGAGLADVAADSIGGDGNAVFMASDDQHLWWVTDGEVNRLYRSGPLGVDVALVFDGINECGGLAVDDTFVYLTDLDANADDRGVVLRFRKP